MFDVAVLLLCHLSSFCFLPGDVDLFLVAPPANEEQVVLSKIYDIVMGSCRALRGDSARLLVTRSRAAITFFKHRGSPIQVVLSTYQSLPQLLVSFDIDAACCAYVLSSGTFQCSPRGRRALEYRVNLIQSEHHSAAYARRLEKYAARGFAVSLPGLDVSLLSPDVLSASHVWMKKRDLLLRVLSDNEDAPGLSSIAMPAGGKAQKVRQVFVRKQRAKTVLGVRRLAVLSFAERIKEVDPPYVAKSTFSRDVVDAHNTDGPLLLHSEEKHDEYWLLWNVASEEDSEDDDDSTDDGVYSLTPAAKAVLLFDSCLKRQSERLAEDGEPSLDDWSCGGVMFRVSKRMASNPDSAKSLADTRIHTQLARNERPSFVYDFVNSKRTFDSLNFVRDAARSPLRDRVSDEEFLQLYGLPKTLSFAPAAERVVPDHDYWSELYGSS